MSFLRIFLSITVLFCLNFNVLLCVKAQTVLDNSAPASAELEEKARLSKNPDPQRPGSGQRRVNDTIPVPPAFSNIPGSRIFGSEFFSGTNITFEPNLKIATPGFYVLGPGDKLFLNIYGNSEVRFNLEVSPDGYINIPHVGPVLVSGISIDQAKAKIKKRLATIYTGIETGDTSFQLTLGDIRSIRVTLVGEVLRPATYTLPSLATIANALYVSGGPSNLGSLRSIALLRNGKQVVVLDFYDFILRGDLSKNVLLHDGDIIHISTYQKRVSLAGAVKHPAVFDLVGAEKLKEVLEFAGGFADNSNKEMITVYRMGNLEREVLNLNEGQLATFVPKSGDSIFVNSILNRFSNRVNISGSVDYPGDYSLNQVRTLKELMLKAGLKENALLSRAVLRRKKADYTEEFISFNVADVLAGKNDLLLVREDLVTIYSIDATLEKFTVTLNGEVNAPGVFPYAENLQLLDLILLGGGFKESASGKRIEVARRIRESATPAGPDDPQSYAIIKIINLDKDYSKDPELVSGYLEPYDIVSIRRLPDYKEQMTVRINGEVKYPGDYVIEKRVDKLSDLVNRAGGLTQNAFSEGAVLIRKNVNTLASVSPENKIQLLVKSSDTTGVSNLDNLLTPATDPVGINLPEALQKPGVVSDIYLEEGDLLYIPGQIQTIRTYGAVNNNRRIIFKEGMTLKDAIYASGGYTTHAKKSGIYVVDPNGEIKATKKFLMFKFYPEVTYGSEIYIPLKEPNRKLTPAEIIAVGSSITGLATLALTVLFGIRN